VLAQQYSIDGLHLVAMPSNSVWNIEIPATRDFILKSTVGPLNKAHQLSNVMWKPSEVESTNVLLILQETNQNLHCMFDISGGSVHVPCQHSTTQISRIVKFEF
jgi:hypothetical protein